MADNFGNGLSSYFPTYLLNDAIGNEDDSTRRSNLSGTAKRYLDCLGLDVEDLFHHVLATLHDPAYREANAGALRMEWPRVPLPGWPDGETEGAAEALAESAARGRDLTALLDADVPFSGVTEGQLQPEFAAVAIPTTTSGRNMTGDDFAVTAGWGHRGPGSAAMPSMGRAVERPYTFKERAALGDALSFLGDTTFDIYLNREAFWRNVLAAVWSYRLGDYQVLKKWLSYRERAILDRPVRPDEIAYFTTGVRRIAFIIMTAYAYDLQNRMRE